MATGAAKSVLIVDDAPFARRVIKDILTNARYNVIAEASNGADAITLYGKLKPDFVTMDLVMPHKGGIEATRQILDRHKEAKIIIISALGHEQVLMDAITAGARDYILKPFTPEELLQAVEKLLEEKKEEETKSTPMGKLTNKGV